MLQNTLLNKEIKTRDIWLYLENVGDILRYLGVAYSSLDTSSRGFRNLPKCQYHMSPKGTFGKVIFCCLIQIIPLQVPMWKANKPLSNPSLKAPLKLVSGSL